MIKVLVADDERWIRKGIVRMIDCEANGIEEVLEAENVSQALEVWGRKRPQIVLADVCFPAENGCDLGDALYEKDPEIKIVMISAHDDFDNVRRALHFHAVDYLLKPVTSKQLNHILAQCVSQIRDKQEESGLREQEQFKKQEPEALPLEDTSARAVERICASIRQNCSRKYTLHDMAEECHVTEAYFSSLFKKVAGKSPMSYVAWARVEKAKELMITTQDKLVRIAAAVGYEDYQYFIKVFKRVTGESPGEYKGRIARENEDGESR